MRQVLKAWSNGTFCPSYIDIRLKNTCSWPKDKVIEIYLSSFCSGTNIRLDRGGKISKKAYWILWSTKRHRDLTAMIIMMKRLKFQRQVPMLLITAILTYQWQSNFPIVSYVIAQDWETFNEKSSKTFIIII